MAEPQRIETGMKSGTAGTFVAKKGRPTRAQVAAIEHSILTVACGLFLENGYANTAMEAVAATAGVSKGTLYARYPAKPDLFRAIVADRIEAWAKAESRDLRKRKDFGMRESLVFYGNRFLAGFRNPEAASFDRLILSESGRFPELAQEFQEQGYNKAVAQLAEWLEAANSDAAAIDDAQSLAVAFTAGLIGWYRSVAAVRPVEQKDCAAFVERLASIFIEGRAAW